ncbi:hypothetical protein LWI29_026530 [Acer saccharum]|uniref:Uncharacterized protein n=1 Tax=Acer saccharum TaxID=4024 RepID=A0AA39SUD0_ACESA|nr:hypothetical protein LWI29_026530 [Acer saccharum]
MKFVKNGYMYRKLAERLGKAPPPPNLMEAPISESLLKSIPKSSDYVAIAFDEGTRNCGLSVLNKNLEDIHPFSVLKKKAGQVGWFALKDMLLREFKDDQVPCFIFGYPASKETPAGYILDLIEFLDKQPEFDDILYTFVNEDYTTKASKKLMFWADMDEEDINKGNLELPRIDWETTFSRKLHSWVNEDGKLVLPTSKVTLDYSNKNRKDLWSSYLIMESGGNVNASGNVNFASGNRNGGNGYVAGNTKSGLNGHIGRNEAVGYARHGSDGINRKMNGDVAETRHEGKEYVKNGNNFSVGRGASGSRFAVLNEEVEASTSEEILVSDSNLQKGNNTFADNALVEITNFSRKQSIKAGKGVKKDQPPPVIEKESEVQGSVNVCELEDIYETEREGIAKLGIHNSAVMHIDNNFDAVASNLEEAMAAISE